MVILISGRPLLLGSEVKSWDALVAAWLPGSEGAGVAETLFGRMGYTGTLPFEWPTAVGDMGKTPIRPLFPAGFGLKTR